MTKTSIAFLARLAAACAVVATLTPVSAQAWWRGGVFIGLPPVVIAPSVAYPPAYYPPPYYAPGAYPPPPYGDPQAPPAQPAPQQTPAPEMSRNDARPFGTTCSAGVYSCAAPAQTPVGTGCACAGIGAPSYGVVQ